MCVYLSAKFEVCNIIMRSFRRGVIPSLSKRTPKKPTQFRVRYLLFVIDVFSENACVKPLKDETGKAILNGFYRSNANQISYVQIKEENVITALSKYWLEDNDFLIFSKHNEGMSVVAQIFIKTLKGRSIKQ